MSRARLLLLVALLKEFLEAYDDALADLDVGAVNLARMAVEEIEAAQGKAVGR